MASTASKMLAIQAESEKGHRHHKHGRGHRHGRGHGHKHDHKKPKSENSSGSEAEEEPESHRRHHGHCGDHHKEGQFTNKKLGIATLLYLATKGGAEVCSLQDRIGSFEKGKAFDALVVSVRDDDTGNPAVWGYNESRDLTEGQFAQSADLNLKQWLERFLFCGDDRNIRKVIVQGAVIGGKEHHA
jgi:guanine deaminase